MAGEAQFRQYDLGTLAAMEQAIARLNRGHKNLRYRFAVMDETQPHFWVFEQILSEEESQCALLKVEKGHVFAIGDDAFQFVTRVVTQK